MAKADLVGRTEGLADRVADEYVRVLVTGSWQAPDEVVEEWRNEGPAPVARK